MKTAIVVGTGAGGATAARELARKGFAVTALEAGGRFRPFRPATGLAESKTAGSPAELLRRLGLLGSTRTIARLFPALDAFRSGPGLVLVRGIAPGGSTVLSCGNIVRATDGLEELGLDLEPEFRELEAEIMPRPFPKERWRPLTARMFAAAAALSLAPAPVPKAVDAGRCVACGLCELGCATGARWDARRFLAEVPRLGGTIVTGSAVETVAVSGGRATGVVARRGRNRLRLEADVIVLAAGGVGTARILAASGLPARGALWADIVLTLGGRLPGARQLEEPPMVWYARQRDYIISPYFDVLSHWFHPAWRAVPARDRVGLMIKLADVPSGTVAADGTVRKEPLPADRRRLGPALGLAARIMTAAGVMPPFVPGMPNGGHLGGTVPLDRAAARTMRPAGLPEGLWVADLSLLPRSQGMPTMLTTAALALRVSRTLARAT